MDFNKFAKGFIVGTSKIILIPSRKIYAYGVKIRNKKIERDILKELRD